MKIKLNMFLMFGLIIAFSILSIGFVSAAVNIPTDGVKIGDIPSTINHDASSFTIRFDITNTGNDGGVVDLTLTLKNGAGYAIGTTSIPGTLSLGNGSIANPVIVPVTGTVNFDAHQSGVIAGELKVMQGGIQKGIASFSVPINNAPALLLTADKTKITTNENVTLTVENTGNTQLNVVLASSGDFGMTIASPSSFILDAGKSIGRIATPTGGDLSGLKFGDHTVTISATDSSKQVQSNVEITFTKSFCKSGETNSNLTITKTRIDTDGEDDKTWKPLDTITVEVDVKNEGDKNIRGVFVVLGLFDSEGKDRSGDLDFINDEEEKIDIGTISDDSKETATFEFKVPVDMDTGDYKLAVKAYSDDLGESKECVSESDSFDNNLYEDISIETETDSDKFIVFDNIEVNPSSGDVTCGDQVTVTADVYNIGDDDEDQVNVILSNSELDLKEEKVIKSLDQGDSSKVTWNFIVPNGVQNKMYPLNFDAQYDYRNGVYRESSSRTTSGVSITITGCSEAVTPTTGKIATISASLGSDAQAGKELLVKATVTGLIDGGADYVVTASDFESWATLNSISERLIHLNKGESKDITLSLNVNKDVTGEQSFVIQALSADKTVTQEIAVNIAIGTGTSTGLNLGGNNLIWIIGIINVVLIILIIIVAARISRR